MHPTRFLSLWSINGPLDVPELRRQMEAFRTAGLDGVVFHPCRYPNDPPYMGAPYLAAVSELILHARDLGMEFWIYDENGWPSGTVDDQMLQDYPDVRQQWAELVETEPDECLMNFKRYGRRWFVARRRGPGVDYLHPDLAPQFLAMTHERYRVGLDPAAFAHVSAFFYEGLEFGLGHVHPELSPHGAIPWTDGLPAAFRARHGENLLALLPGIFFSRPSSARLRVKFWELLRDRFCEGFLAPLDAWCRLHGKRHAAHIKGEEHPLFQVAMVGSCHAVFRHLSLPGIDALEGFPGNDYFPRQAASVAAQFGDGRCMAEAFGGTAWGATTEDLVSSLLWLGQHGVTDFVLHLPETRLDTAALRDRPPSQPLHLNWHENLPKVLNRVRQTLASHTGTAAAPDTLVVSPHRGIMEHLAPWELPWMNIRNARSHAKSRAGGLNDGFLARVRDLNAIGTAHHFTDEATLEAAGVVEDGGFRLGQCRYRRVLLADGVSLGSAGRQLIEAVGGAASWPGRRESFRGSRVPPSDWRDARLDVAGAVAAGGRITA